MNAFELAAQYRSLDNVRDEDGNLLEPEELARRAIELEGAIEQKVESIGFALRNRTAAKNMLVESVANLNKRIASLEDEEQRLAELALELLRLTERKKVEGAILKVSRQNNPPSVDVFDPTLITGRFKKWTEPVQRQLVIDRKALLIALNDGEIIEGARRVVKERIVIK